jgi:hypothetical protein
MLLLVIEKKNLYIWTRHEEKYLGFYLILYHSVTLVAVMQNI